MKIEFNLSKKATLLLATFAPLLIGCLYYVLLRVPVMGDLWFAIAPFAVLVYWGFVGGLYRESEIKFWKSFGISHAYAVVCFVLYVVFFYSKGIMNGRSVIDQIISWFTYPLCMITASLATIIHGSEIADIFIAFCTQLYGLILMMLAFMIGYGKKHADISKVKRKEERLKAESQRIQSATNIFKKKEDM